MTRSSISQSCNMINFVRTFCAGIALKLYWVISCFVVVVLQGTAQKCGGSRKAAKATSLTAVRQKTFKELTVVRRSTCQAFKETNPKTILWLSCHNFIDPFCSDCQLMLQGKEMVVMFVSELKPIEMSF
ncbi:PREDICTED: uncharacterized protein LOC107333857 [Acropora digitifera]|uniref:uncharacterized protein LOC107333857 n=1 Tax=Acropora digitifera TaxID=70779 RepID=UPI00077A3558|nr:PREDICTED: uncharacterized protein LOC107333857 [Acropora digitifera]